MTITEKQINELESLIIEGIIVQNSLIQTKKNYIDKAQCVLKGFCQENHETIPVWIEIITPPVFVGDTESSQQTAKTYYSDLFPYFLNMLRELQSQYYKRMQLHECQEQTSESHTQSSEIKEQTKEVQKQTIEAQKANKWTKWALWISILAVFVSIVAVCVSTYTRTIKIDETQYNDIKEHCLFERQL